MSIKSFIPALAVAAGALAIAVAPAAAAAPTGPVCATTGSTSTVCQTDGNAQLSATPPDVDYQAQYPFYGPETLLFHNAIHHR
ncbi:MAG: hypothetical protein JST91_23650 [Actinobacteria bacterium]|nr:hypothetical protein [Actinomycetota bacterium]